MKYLVDTGIMLRLFDERDPQCVAIRTALRRLRSNRDELFFTAQNAAEFWNVSTRPTSARGEYGHAPDIVVRRLAFIQIFGNLVFESPASFEAWKGLLRNTLYAVSLFTTPVS